MPIIFSLRPDNFVLLIEGRILVRDMHNLTGVFNLLPRNPHLIPHNPKLRYRVLDHRVIISILFLSLQITRLRMIRHQAQNSLMASEFLRIPDTAEQRRFLSGQCLGRRSLHLGRWNAAGFREVIGLVVRSDEHVGLAISVIGIGEIVHERFERVMHRYVVDGCGAEEDRHKDDGTGRGIDGEETDEADFREIDAGHHLLEYFGVGSAFGIDVVGEDVKRVIAGCDVDDAEADSRETED